MKHYLLIPAILLIICSSYAQNLTGDKITTDQGDLIIHPVLHGTFVMQWNGLTIYNDP